MMVDIETTGLDIDNTAILQIAAVKFNYMTGEIDDNFFNASMTIPPGRYWDEGTRTWWGKQKPHILQEITRNGRHPQVVMREYYDWLLKDYPDTNDGLRFWGKPTHFDFSFIDSYLKQYGLTNPCSFRFARDMNSFMAGLSGDPTHPDMEKRVEFDGDAHNALYDTIYQIKVLFEMKKRFTACENIYQ